MLCRVAEERIVCDEGQVPRWFHGFCRIVWFSAECCEKARGEAYCLRPTRLPGNRSTERIGGRTQTHGRQTDWAMNPGNWFLEHIKAKAVADARAQRLTTIPPRPMSPQSLIFSTWARAN